MAMSNHNTTQHNTTSFITTNTIAMSNKPDYDTDLVSLLPTEEREELIRLITSIIETMRASINRSSSPSKPKPDEADERSNLPTAETHTSTKHPPEKLPSPQLLKVQKAELSSFDTWADSVLVRITEVLKSPSSSSSSTQTSTYSSKPTTPTPSSNPTTHRTQLLSPHPITKKQSSNPSSSSSSPSKTTILAPAYSSSTSPLPSPSLS
ncbi:hypothetical protein BDD12DRAFT_985826, partial [Trichophaea hybrida]